MKFIDLLENSMAVKSTAETINGVVFADGRMVIKFSTEELANKNLNPMIFWGKAINLALIYNPEAHI